MRRLSISTENWCVRTVAACSSICPLHPAHGAGRCKDAGLTAGCGAASKPPRRPCGKSLEMAGILPA